MEGRLLDPGLWRRLRHNLLLLQDGQALAQAQNGGLRRRLQQQQLRVQVAHISVCDYGKIFFLNFRNGTNPLTGRDVVNETSQFLVLELSLLQIVPGRSEGVQHSQ